MPNPKKALDCFEYQPKWTEIVPRLLSGDPSQVADAVREMEDNARFLENFLKLNICDAEITPGGDPFGDSVNLTGDGSSIIVTPGTPYDLPIWGDGGGSGADETFLVWGTWFIANTATPGAEIWGSASLYDGVSEVFTHEFHMTDTDQYLDIAHTGRMFVESDRTLYIRFRNYGADDFFVQGQYSILRITTDSGH